MANCDSAPVNFISFLHPERLTHTPINRYPQHPQLCKVLRIFRFLVAGKIFVFSPLLVDIGGQWWTSTIVHQIFFRALQKCLTFAP